MRSGEWHENGCELDYEQTTDEVFACNCSFVGSADIQIIVRQLFASKPSLKVNVLSFDDLSYFGQLGDNYIPLVVLSVIDLIYFTLMVSACYRSNESRVRRYDYFYSFWRAQHSLNMAARAKPGFRKRTWTQLKAQHKLLVRHTARSPLSSAHKLNPCWART